MRSNPIAWFVVAFFFIGGVIFWFTIPEIYIGQIWVGVSTLLGLFFWGLNRRAARADAIIRAGIKGEATILGATQTGTYINNQPRVKLRLRVQTPYAEFEDERTETVPLISLGLLTSGRPLTVYADPKNPNEYVIDWSSVAV